MKYSKEDLKQILLEIENKENKVNVIQKTVSFLDLMVKVVFFSTFIFTMVSMYIAYINSWEQAFITLIERWFTIMVGEIVVMGVIQIVKEVMENRRMKIND